jgi:DNA-binding transcriptional ArsR family regulator
MLTQKRSAGRARIDPAAAFAALGDATRLALVGKLSDGTSYSIARLAEGSPITRQAVTKHLQVLERAGIVRSRRAGRESLYHLDHDRILAMRSYLDGISHHWDDALKRLKSFVED